MSDYGNRPDGTAKGKGYFGELINKDGDVVTEMTIGVNIDGQEVDIPLVHPFLTGSEINQILELEDGEQPPENLVRSAVDYAIYRKQSGLPVYATEDELGKIPLPKGVKQYKSALGLVTKERKQQRSNKAQPKGSALGLK